MVICGLDLSKTHYALYISDIKIDYRDYVFGWQTESAVKKWQKKYDDTCYYIYSLPKKEAYDSADKFDMEIGNIITKQIVDNIFFTVYKSDTVLISLEGYAYASNPFTVIPIAEVTRAVKQELYNAGYAIRIHDPLTVKMWAGDAQYKKPEMLREARKHIDIPEHFSKTKSNCPAYDIADAFWLCDMLQWEVLIRRDPTQMKNLTEQQLQVVNRISKFYPVNLLNRPFLAKEQPDLLGG